MKFKENMRRREIKFRAWDVGKNEMEYFDLTSLYWRGEETGKYDFPNGLEVMQFTGLLDKDGKEIYEDDVIEWELQTRFCDFTIKTQVRFDSLKGVHPFVDPKYQIMPDGVEVIGNTYEHPDLIKG